MSIYRHRFLMNNVVEMKITVSLCILIQLSAPHTTKQNSNLWKN